MNFIRLMTVTMLTFFVSSALAETSPKKEETWYVTYTHPQESCEGSWTQITTEDNRKIFRGQILCNNGNRNAYTVELRNTDEGAFSGRRLEHPDQVYNGRYLNAHTAQGTLVAVGRTYTFNARIARK